MLESPFVGRHGRFSFSVGVALLLLFNPPLGLCLQPESLEKRIEAIEEIDQELAETAQKLKTEKAPSGRHALESQMRTLKARQEKLLLELEEIVGPPRPAVRPETPLPMEQQMKTREQRQETTLDNDAQRRNP